MNPFSFVFNEFFYQPLFNGLIFLYNLLPWPDLGLTIILATILIRLALYPLNQKAIVSQKALAELQPQMKEIQEKHKNNKTEQSQALMAFYKEKGVNPASGCLPLLIQLPILFALYKVFMAMTNGGSLDLLYPFISRPEHINTVFLGILDLTKANTLLAVLAGAATYWQSKITVGAQTKSVSGGKADFGTMMSKQMLYFMPLFTVFIAWRLPAGLTLYWVAVTLLGIGQQYLVFKKNDPTTNKSN
ncbi:MAG: YidC/Oxa1 family membrane protein insertase [Patescibacteria group bacterium]